MGHSIAGRTGRISLALLLSCSLAANALAQDAASVSTPIPEGDPAAVVKELGLIESAKPVREMIPNWRKPAKVVVFVDNNTNRLAWMQEAVPGIKLVAAHNRAEGLKEIVDADAQIGGSCQKELVLAGKALRYVHDQHAGMDGCFGGTVPPQLKSGAVVVTNLQRVLGTAVATHAIAMMLTLMRGIDLYVRMNKDGHFTAGAVAADKLWLPQGRTLLVAGLGGIGSEMARLGHQLGMHVIATKNSDRDHPDYVDYVGLADELPAMIGKADVVMSALPLTPQTTGLFNAALFAKMKKGAIFINIARGKEAVTADLLAALKSGQLGGAGLDVTDPDRLPDNDPLYNAPNIILTPHMSSQAIDADNGFGGEMTWQVARENLRRYVAGDKLYSLVDPVRGY